MKLLPIPPGMETEAFVMDSGALHDVPELVRRCFQSRRPWIVADENTWKAAGAALFAILKSAGLEPHEPFVFPAVPMIHADNALTPRLTDAMPFDCVPVSVGGGTINDLVKRASAVTRHRYLCVPTACSVDGYTSYGAAMTDNGLKKTLPCLAPLAVAADTDVLKAAPAPMAASGYADLAAKVAGGADWVIADELGIEPIRADVWELVQKDLRQWISDPADIGAVFLGLAATGYSMQMYRESRPASGAEHMISHLWEMENLMFEGVPVSHGFKVGIGTLASTALMEWLFNGHDANWARANARPPRTEQERRAEVDALLSRGCYGAKTGEIAMGKFLAGEALAARRELIFEHWDALAKRTAECLIPFDTLTSMFRAASCPVTPAGIGLDAAQFKHGILAAQLIRNRYTILDVLDELGLLREAADAVTALMTGKS